MKLVMKQALVFLAASSAYTLSIAAEMTGAGATFVYPAMSRWSADYNAATKNQVNYQSIGSGGGIAQIKAGTVDFGSTDAPLKPEEVAAAGLAQFPSVLGGVVPVVNLKGIAPGQLKLNGQLLGDIYLGKVTMWNAPEIAALNAGLALPNTKISVVHRSDGSGTTFNFANYLSKVNADWKSKVGEGVAVRWPAGLGGKGNEGVAAYTKRIPGAIGYVELSYALVNKMSHVSMQNAAGKFVQPNLDSLSAAAASADWKNSKDFYLIITNAPGEASWPITATNFMLMRKAPKSVERAKSSLEFFTWVYANGDASAEKLGYVPLPDALVAQVTAYWAANLKY
jgi:phosphate transport system substrate-binding protein